ncbi:hypothetical protein ACTA71_003598 [Dictyostelium dimigraforme]
MSETIDNPTVEEYNEKETVVAGEEIEQEIEQENEQVSQSFQISIKTPVEIGTIKIQVQPTDTLMDIQTFLYETSETCLYSSYEFRLNGKSIPEYSELSSIEGLIEGVTLEMVPIDYNERSAKLHVKRLRDIMNTGLTEFANMNNPSLFSSFSFPEKSNILTEEQQLEEQKQKSEQQQQQQQQQQQSEEKETIEQQPNKKNNKYNKKGNKKGEESSTTNDEEKLTPQQKERKQKMTEIKGIEKPILSNYYPESPIAPVQCVKSMIYSGWSPVPGYRKLFGDLFYLDITLLEGTTVCVTASTQGFFINQSSNATFNPSVSPKATINHSLHQLLTQVSRLFRRGLNQILANIGRNHPFDMLPGVLPVHNWVASSKSNRYDINKGTDTFVSVQDVELRGNPRDWNEEIQAPKELPKSTVQERIIRDRAISKVNSEFVECAVRGAQVIVDKAILPINPTENERSHMFLYNNIFFSYALDTRDSFNDCGGDAGARTSANNDLKGIRLYNLADVEGIYTLGTAIVDYKGQRIIAQSLIPGILTTEKTSKIYYGSMDASTAEGEQEKQQQGEEEQQKEGEEKEENKNIKSIKADPEFHSRLLQAASLLHLSESKVISEEDNKEVSVCTSFESKGIVGIDGRRYILDLIKATPRDPNYLDAKDQLAILRPEAIATYSEYYKATWLAQKRQQKLKEKEEKQKKEGIDPPTATAKDEDVQLTEEDLAQSPMVSFNPNLFSKVKLGGSQEEQQKDIDELKAVGAFLKGILIPRLIEDLMLFNVAPVDGQTLTQVMHLRGINMRYLGFIAKNESANVPFIQDLLFNEMVSRAAKHCFNKLLRSTNASDMAHSISHFLNCFLGTETGSVSQDEKSKKAKQIKSSAINELTQGKLWSEISELVASKFDFEIPTHSVPMESRLIVLRCICLKMGIQILAKDYNFTTDAPFSSEDIVDLFPIVKHVNPRSTDGLDLLEAGKSFFNQRKFDLATEFLGEALAIYHQVHGPIHQDAGTCFTHLAMLAFQNEQYDLAIEYQKNALVISEKTSGLDHHETVQAYTTLAVFCQRSGRFNESIGYMKHVLYLTDLLGGEYNPERSSIYTTIAAILEDTDRFDLALDFLKQTLKHQEFLFTPDHLMCSSTYHKMAIVCARAGNFDDSIIYQKKSTDILEKELGEAHPRSKESLEFYNGLSQTANQIKLFKQHQAMKAEQDELARLQKEKVDQFKKSQSRVSPMPPSLENGSVSELLNYINGKPKKSQSKKSKSTTTTTTTTTTTSKSKITMAKTTPTPTPVPTKATTSKSSATASSAATNKSTTTTKTNPTSSSAADSSAPNSKPKNNKKSSKN